jgi:hypothetical protein
MLLPCAIRLPVSLHSTSLAGYQFCQSSCDYHHHISFLAQAQGANDQLAQWTNVVASARANSLITISPEQKSHLSS